MHQTDLPPQTHRLRGEQALSLPLEQGSELFCLQGPLRLAIGPLGFTDNHFSQIVELQTGQSWRCPSSTWVQLSALEEAAAVQSFQARIQQSRLQANMDAERLQKREGWSPAMTRIWQQLSKLSFRRGQRAA